MAANVIAIGSGSGIIASTTPYTCSVGTFKTDPSVLAFIREQTIGISAFGMRPNTRLYVFFDGVLMSGTNSGGASYITPALLDFTKTSPTTSDYQPAGAPGSALYSDSQGRVAALLHIPPGIFYAGTRPIVITDVSSLVSLNAATTTAVTNFNAFNYLNYVPDQTVISTRPITTTTPSTTDQTTSVVAGGSTSNVIASTSSNTASLPNANGGIGLIPPSTFAGLRNFDFGQFHLDPLAQAFYVGSDGLGALTGIYLTSVDLYFASADPVLGVTVEIRTMQNGTPTTTVVPLSQVHLNANQVNVDATTASAKTTVTFPSPVFLAAGFSYALCITPDGSNPNYTVWTAAVGGTDVATSQAITKNWGSGDLFTSTNGETWVPVPNEFMKFTLYNANFTATSGSVSLTNRDFEFFAVTNATSQYEIGEYAFISGLSPNVFITSGSNSVATVSTSSLTLTLTSGNSVYANNTGGTISSAGFTAFTDNTALIVSNGSVYDVLFVSGTPSSNTTLTLKNYPKFSGSVSLSTPPVGKVFEFDPTRLILTLDESNASNTNYFVSSNSTNTYYIIGTRSGANSKIKTLRNRTINRFMTNFNTVVPTGSSLQFNMVNTVRYNYSNTVQSPFNLTGMNYFSNAEIIVASKSNEIVNMGSAKSLVANIVLASTSNTSSPVLDLSATSLLGFRNIISGINSVQNENTKTGLIQNKYITKTVTLANGLDSEDLVVYLSAYQPPGTYINVYGKFLAASDPEPFDNKDWTLLQQNSASFGLYSSASDLSDINEYQYSVAPFLPSVPKPGYIAFTAGSNTITGTNTSFYTDAPVGSIITVFPDSTYLSSQTVRVTAVNSNTSINVDQNISYTTTGGTYQYSPVPKSAFLNQNNSGLIRYYGSNGIAYDNFITFAIKIALVSNTNYSVPRVLNLRAVAATV